MHHTSDVISGDPTGRTDLHRATEDNNEDAVKNILASPLCCREQLNSIDSTNGWTPLFIASVKGLTTIARLLLVAGANQDIVDLGGWSAKEHAVFRGHISLGLLFAPHDKPFGARLGAQDRHLIEYKKQSDISQMFVYLGPSHTRNNLAPVEIDLNLLGGRGGAAELADFGIMIKCQGVSNKPLCDLQLPILQNLVNKPVSIFTQDPEKSILTFEVYRRSSNKNDRTEVYGTATALMKGLRHGLSPRHECLTRHYTIPLIQNSKMTCIGSVTFSVLIVTPFHSENPPPTTSLGFWKKKGPYPIVGHRGSGANSTARTVLQIGENTLQSFLTAIDRGVSGVEFDVQLTKDYHTVIYHDFLVKETGGDIPLQELTLDQFEYFSRSQAPKNDLLSRSERKFIENMYQDGDLRPYQRRHSLNGYDNLRSLDLLERIRYTDEGQRGDVKGNLRGCVIQEPSATLEQLLKSLPEHLDFDLEIKYPMLWEAENRAIEFVAIELNTYVDTIIKTLYRHCGKRNITLTSFSPEVCIALACKQRSFPILMINKAGTVPAGDIRAASLQGAIDFATAWNLDGIVAKSTPFIMCPRLLTYAKDMGLVVCSYGELNNEPNYVKIQIEAGLDAIITDRAHLISKSIAHIRR